MNFRVFLRSRELIVVIGALIMGFISGRLLLFEGSALNTLPWGVLALASSLLASTKRQAMRLGGIFGFVVSFSFLWFNNTDPKTLSRVALLVTFAAVAALFGLLCGMMLGYLGWKARRLYNRNRPEGR